MLDKITSLWFFLRFRNIFHGLNFHSRIHFDISKILIIYFISYAIKKLEIPNF